MNTQRGGFPKPQPKPVSHSNGGAGAESSASFVRTESRGSPAGIPSVKPPGSPHQPAHHGGVKAKRTPKKFGPMHTGFPRSHVSMASSSTAATLSSSQPKSHDISQGVKRQYDLTQTLHRPGKAPALSTGSSAGVPSSSVPNRKPMDGHGPGLFARTKTQNSQANFIDLTGDDDVSPPRKRPPFVSGHETHGPQPVKAQHQQGSAVSPVTNSSQGPATPTKGTWRDSVEKQTDSRNTGEAATSSRPGFTLGQFRYLGALENDRVKGIAPARKETLSASPQTGPSQPKEAPKPATIAERTQPRQRVFAPPQAGSPPQRTVATQAESPPHRIVATQAGSPSQRTIASQAGSLSQRAATSQAGSSLQQPTTSQARSLSQAVPASSLPNGVKGARPAPSTQATPTKKDTPVVANGPLVNDPLVEARAAKTPKKPDVRKYKSTLLDAQIYSQEGARAPPPGVVLHRQDMKLAKAAYKPLYMHTNPRIHTMHDRSQAWYQEKFEEIKRRGGRKRFFGQPGVRRRWLKSEREIKKEQQQKAASSTAPVPTSRKDPEPWTHQRPSDFWSMQKEELPTFVQENAQWLKIWSLMRKDKEARLKGPTPPLGAGVINGQGLQGAQRQVNQETGRRPVT